MTMTATRPAPFPAKAPPRERKPALRWYLIGRYFEHCPAEALIVPLGFLAFVYLFASFGGTTTGAYVAAAAVTAPLAWWLNGEGSRRRRYARRVEARWAKACARFGLYTFTRFGVTRFPDLANISVDDHRNVTADITLPPNLWFSRLHKVRDQIESAYAGGNLRSLAIHGDDDHRTGRLVITRWVAFDRFTDEAFAYRPGEGIAVRESGENEPLPIPGPHTLVVGASRSGKSSYVNAGIAESLVQPYPVTRWGVDLKIVELEPWRRVFDRLAVEPEEATQLLTVDLPEEIDRRRHWLAARGLRKWDPRCAQGDDPLHPLLLVIDELSQAVWFPWPGEDNTFPRDRLANTVRAGAVGAALGIQLLVATQEPLAEVIGRIRANCQTTICCRVRTETDSFTALGDLGRQLEPHKLRLRGSAWVVAEGADPYKARARWLDDDDVARLAGAAR